MAGTVDDDSTGGAPTGEAPLLKSWYLFVFNLTDHSESLTKNVLQAFFSHGPVDREGRERYTVFETKVELPEGRLEAYGRPIYNQRNPQFWYSDRERGISCVYDFRNSEIRWSGPMVYPKAPSDDDEEDEEVWEVDPRFKAQYHLIGIRPRREVMLDFLRRAGWLLVQQPTEMVAEPVAEPAAEPTQPQPEPEVTSEATDTAAGGCIAKRKKEAQLKIAEAAKKIWPPDGIVPLDSGPADLMHAIEDLYKREAAEKSQAGKPEKPHDPPSWSSCKRFLEGQRST